MISKILFLASLLVVLTANLLSAQDEFPKDWNTEKIRGIRFIPYDHYKGDSYLTVNFVPGELTLDDSTHVAGLHLRYSEYRDELIYFNADISTQILVDRSSVLNFSLTDDKGALRVFRQQYYDGFMPGNRFFEILAEGVTSLLVYRKVVLQDCPAYYDETRGLKNMSFQEAFSYYLYNDKKGYEPISLDKKSLLSKFSESDQNQIRRILRENKIHLRDEDSFVLAWKLIEAGKIKPTFGSKP